MTPPDVPLMVRVRRGDNELEVQGDRAFVGEMLDRFDSLWAAGASGVARMPAARMPAAATPVAPPNGSPGGLMPEEIARIALIEGNNIRLLTAPTGSTADQQREAAIILLTLHAQTQRQRTLTAPIIREALEGVGIGSMPNMAKNLKGATPHILMRGDRQTASYTLTGPGEVEGMRLIRRLVEMTAVPAQP